MLSNVQEKMPVKLKKKKKLQQQKRTHGREDLTSSRVNV